MGNYRPIWELNIVCSRDNCAEIFTVCSDGFDPEGTHLSRGNICEKEFICVSKSGVCSEIWQEPACQARPSKTGQKVAINWKRFGQEKTPFNNRPDVEQISGNQQSSPKQSNKVVKKIKCAKWCFLFFSTESSETSRI